VSSDPTSSIVRFGEFTVDLEAGELLRGGVKVKLQGQPFQILVILLNRPGHIVSREELRRSLWASDTFVDFEHGLNAAINRLREALGDSSDEPRFIETLPRRGYRFIFPLTDPISRRSPFRTKWVLGTVVVVSVLSAGLVAWHSFRSWLVGQPSLRVIQFTSNPGAEFQPAFSPDGREIAFVSDAAGVGSHIYAKLIGSERPLRLTQGSGWACCPAWSPDGRYVAFERCGDNKGDNNGLFIVPALGGPERKLPAEETCGDGLSWSPDGKFLALPGHERSDQPRIYLFSVDTLKRKKLTSLPSPFVGDTQPAFSPDGKLIAFVRSGAYSVGDIYVVAIDQGGEGQRVTFDRAWIRGIAWTADGKGLIYASNRSGLSKLWRVRVSGGQPEPLSVGGERAKWPAISPTGDRLAYTEGLVRSNIWRKAILAGEKSAFAASRVSPSTIGDGDPQFSPDGTKIVFASSRSGKSHELWICDAECTDPVQLTSRGVYAGSPRWSPDGSQIAFDSRNGVYSQIFVIESRGGIPRQVTSGEFEHVRPAWSRDGRWLYFASNPSGEMQLWKIPAAGGAQVQITHHGGFHAQESLDGRWLYYTKEDDIGIYRVSPSGEEEGRLLDVSLAGPGYWDVGKRGIYFVENSSGSAPAVKHYNFANHRVIEITSLEHPPFSDLPGFAVSPGEHWILYLQPEATTDVILVENFH